MSLDKNKVPCKVAKLAAFYGNDVCAPEMEEQICIELLLQGNLIQSVCEGAEV